MRDIFHLKPNIYLLVIIFIFSNIAFSLEDGLNTIGQILDSNASNGNITHFHVTGDPLSQTDFKPPFTQEELKSKITTYLKKLISNGVIFKIENDLSAESIENFIAKINDINISFLPPNVKSVSIEKGQIRGDCRYSIEGSSISDKKNIVCTGSLFERYPEFKRLSPRALSFFLHEILGALDYHDFSFQVSALFYLHSIKHFKNYLPKEINLTPKKPEVMVDQEKPILLADGGSTVGSGGGEYFLLKAKTLILSTLLQQTMSEEASQWHTKNSLYFKTILMSEISYTYIDKDNPGLFFANPYRYAKGGDVVSHFFYFDQHSFPLSKPAYFFTYNNTYDHPHIKVIESQWDALFFFEKLSQENNPDDEIFWSVLKLLQKDFSTRSISDNDFKQLNSNLMQKVTSGAISEDTVLFIISYIRFYPQLIFAIQKNKDKPHYILKTLVLKELIQTLEKNKGLLMKKY